MDTHNSKPLCDPLACGRPPSTRLGVYGCGQPAADQSSSNSSTVTSMASNAGSDEERAQRRSPFSSDSSELEQSAPLASGLAEPPKAMAATARSKGVTKEPRPAVDTMSPCDNCKTAQQQRTCSFYSEPVSWRQDSSLGSERRSSRDKADAPRKETSIAVQRHGAAGQPAKEGRVGRTAGAHIRRAHAHGSGSDRLPLHRILNDPRVYYVVAFAGLAALVVVSGTGIALAAHRRRRRRHRRGLVRGLTTAKDMVAAALTTWVTYSRWFRRLVFK